MVQVGGIRSGRVKDVDLAGDHVVVTFEVDDGVELGETTGASVEVLNLLGEKYLKLSPDGDGRALRGRRDPARAHRVGLRHRRGLRRPHHDHRGHRHRPAGARRCSRCSAPPSTRPRPRSRPASTASRGSRAPSPRATPRSRPLLASSRQVSTLLAARSEDLVDLMGSSDLVFEEVEKRKEAIHRLLVNARRLAVELRGVATDNQAQIGPALKEVDDLLDTADQQGEGAEGDAQRVRALRQHPVQHHRHRALVRRLRRQPGLDPHRRVRPGGPPMSALSPAAQRRVARERAGRRCCSSASCSCSTTTRRPPGGSPPTSRARSASTRAPTCGSSASTSARSPR